MCDCLTNRGVGWKGWQDYPFATQPKPIGDWHDLSHPLSSLTPRVPAFPPPVFDYFRKLPEDVINISRMQMVCHIGTHVDSPRHFFLDGPGLDEIPLARLCGQGVVWPVHLDGGRMIEPEHLQGLEDRLYPGDILILDTGAHLLVGTAEYDNAHPALSAAAAEWIVARRVKLLGLDTPTPDLPGVVRPPGFDFPIHRILLSHGTLIAEHLTNLAPLHGKEVEVICGALNISGGDGGPARIMARKIEPRHHFG